MASVKKPTAALGATVAGQLVAGILNGELVVIGELLTTKDAAQGEDDNVLLAFHVNDSRETVGLTGVVDESGGITMHRGIHHIKVIHAEHVAPNALQGQGGGSQVLCSHGWPCFTHLVPMVVKPTFPS